MSEQTKKQMQQIKKSFETIKKISEEDSGITVKLDKELSQKIKKVSENAQEVIKHIEKKGE